MQKFLSALDLVWQSLFPDSIVAKLDKLSVNIGDQKKCDWHELVAPNAVQMVDHDAVFTDLISSKSHVFVK